MYKQYYGVITNSWNNKLLIEFLNCAYKDINFKNFDWKSGPEDRNWWWQVQQLPFLKWFVGAEEGLDKYQRGEAFQYVISCLNCWKKESSTGTSPLLWHDHATAFRLRHLTIFYCWLKDNPEFDYSLCKLSEIIEEHLAFLHEDRNYSKHTNHGFDQACEVYAPLLSTSKSDYYSEYSERAKERIVDELYFAFTPEGVHKENSPGYQKYMLGRLKNIDQLRMFAECSLQFDSKELVESAERFYKAITLPDGNLPLIGDTQLAPGAQKDSTLITAIHDFSNSGYVIAEGLCSERKVPYHLVIKSGFHSNYHRHDDDLSIHLWVDGSVILGDGGLLSHNELNSDRKLLRSFKSHNVPYYEGIAHERDINKIEKSSTLYIDDGLVNGETFPKSGGKLTRKVDLTLLEGGGFVVEDKISQIEKSLCLNFLIPEDIKVYIGYKNVRLKADEHTIKIDLSSNCEPLEILITDTVLSETSGELKKAKRLSIKSKASRLTWFLLLNETSSSPLLEFLERNELFDLNNKDYVKSLLACVSLERSNVDQQLNLYQQFPNDIDTRLLYFIVRSCLVAKQSELALHYYKLYVARSDHLQSDKEKILSRTGLLSKIFRLYG